ncbi:unnamed protein product, partial [Rhizophagus irregularis]
MKKTLDIYDILSGIRKIILFFHLLNNNDNAYIKVVVAVVAVINAVAITLLEIVTIPTTAVINAEKKGILAVIVMNNPKKIERKRAIHV